MADDGPFFAEYGSEEVGRVLERYGPVLIQLHAFYAAARKRTARRKTMDLHAWFACLADMGLLSNESRGVTTLTAQRVFASAQFEDSTASKKAVLLDTEMDGDEFVEGIARAAWAVADAIPVGHGDSDGRWKALLPPNACGLAFALEALVGSLLSRWKENDPQALRRPIGRRMRALLTATSAVRAVAIGIAERAGPNASQRHFFARAPALAALSVVP